MSALRQAKIELPQRDHKSMLERSLLMSPHDALLRANLPFEVELTPSVANHLRAQHVATADEKTHTVTDVSYGSDEGGMMCHILRPGREGIVISLTYIGPAD